MTEKEQLGSSRLNQLYNGKMNPKNLIPSEVFEYKIEAEKRFGNILMTPLDIPVIDNSGFVKWYWDHAVPIKKIASDIATPRTDLQPFLSVDVVHNGSEWVYNQKGIWETNYQKEFQTIFPKLTEQLYEYFPFEKIDKYCLWSSTEPIGLHRDPSIFLDIPGSLRVMLYDDNPTPTLYVKECPADSSINQSDDRAYVSRLPDTNSFAWNNLRIKHGSDHSPNNRKILLIFNLCTMDWKKYIDLLDRSVSKYANHCLKSSLEITDFVDQTSIPGWRWK